MKYITENFTKIFGKVTLAVMFATILFAGSIFTVPSIADAESQSYPQCSDDKDNDGDGLIDYEDPDCRTDGDVNNNGSYDWQNPDCHYDDDWQNPDCYTDGDVNNNGSYDPEDNNESTLGSITVCKIIIDGEEDIVDGYENYGQFTVEGIEITGHPTVADSVGVLSNAVFETTITYETDLIGNDQVNDAMCVPYDNLALGGYFYGEETIVGEYWQTPLYNDQVDGPITLNNLYQYSGELFTTDAGDDENRDINADGHIVLSESRPDRTLVVLNQYDLPPEEITVVATKIVCDDEDYLPNWGVTQTPIDGNTVSNFLNTGDNGQHCSVAQDWQFQWGNQNVSSPGDDFYGEAPFGEGWTTFGPTDVNGETILDIGIDNITQIRIREVLKDGYLPFTYNNDNNDNNVSAEMYCHMDTINYDNFDFITGLNVGGTYYCVAFNAEVSPANVPPVITLAYNTLALVLGDIFDPFIGHATTSDADGDIVTLYASSTVPVNISGTTTATGTYDVVYTAEDEHGAEAIAKTLSVIVSLEVPPICPNVVVVSNTDDMVVDGGVFEKWAEATYNGNLRWTAVIDLATWIWESYTVQNPETSETVNFTKDFEIVGIPTTAVLKIAADNIYTAQINGIGVATSTDENNYQLETQDEYDVSGMLHAGINTIMFEVTNLEPTQTGGTAQSNPAGLLYRLEIEIEGDSCLMENTGPEILGADTPLVLYVGESGDLDNLARVGVTADDTEDGNLTAEIVITGLGTIDTSNVGTTSITYTVDDYGYPVGIDILSDTVVREVQVVAVDVNEPPTAVLKADPLMVYVGDLVAFDAASSTDDVGIVEYLIEFGDGATSSLAISSHSYNATGTYPVLLTVTDGNDATSTDMVEITVVSEDNPVNPGDVIINELMWMGSATSTADEWVELKNNTASGVDLDGCRLIKKNGDTIADLEGYSIDTDGYLVVSRKSREESNIDTVTQDILSYLALSNTELKIELYCGSVLIDTAGDGSVPLAGDNGDQKKSMQKCGDDWEDALVGGEVNNWDANTTDFGTPGLANVCEYENTPPAILGADNPLVFYIGDVNTELELEALARLGVTATDTQDVIPAGDIVITGLGGVSTSTVGTTTISYDVDDYGNPALPAQTVVREVRTVTQCSDGLDNDTDTFIDVLDSGCWTDPTDSSTYDPQDNDESYTGPVEYPQCSDDKDNDGDGLTDYEDPGCHTDGDVNNDDSYDPQDDDEDNTSPTTPYCGDGACNGSETCSSCAQDCGGCGGGGGGWFFPTTIVITNEDVDYLGSGNAMITWKTNIPATSQVVYGDDSLTKSGLGVVPEYGYDSVNEESLALKTSHNMLITGLTHGTQYYFRPVSDKSGVTEAVGKEVTYTFIQVPPVCNYLLEYIKLGSVNNPVEVEKLERFLNEFEGENLAVDGIYDQTDYEAVKRFQVKYREDILDPWNHDEATGYVYITTKKKINEIYCEREFPLTSSQEAEVISFSSLMEGLQGVATGALGEMGIDVGDVVGVAGDVDSSGALADASGATTGTTSGEETGGVLADGTTAEDDDSEEGSRNLASVIYSGVLDFATSFWFILILVLIAIILFFRIRGAKVKE